MPRRMAFRNESARFFQSLRVQGSQANRAPLSQQESDAWHAAQGARQSLERARNNYYLTHDSGSPLFPGDEEIEQ